MNKINICKIHKTKMVNTHEENGYKVWECFKCKKMEEN